MLFISSVFYVVYVFLYFGFLCSVVCAQYCVCWLNILNWPFGFLWRLYWTCAFKWEFQTVKRWQILNKSDTMVNRPIFISNKLNGWVFLFFLQIILIQVRQHYLYISAWWQSIHHIILTYNYTFEEIRITYSHHDNF
jgi:hypothetical protein